MTDDKPFTLKDRCKLAKTMIDHHMDIQEIHWRNLFAALREHRKNFVAKLKKLWPFSGDTNSKEEEQ